MRVYFDTEFLEDGKTIELISIGMVAEDGRELYAVSEEVAENPLHDRICRHQWLMGNVVPHLPFGSGTSGTEKGHGRLSGSGSGFRGFFNLDMTSNEVMPRRMIRNAVQAFLQDTPDVELWAWYAAYDFVALAQLWGPLMDIPDGIPMWVNDLRSEVHRLGNPQLPEQPQGHHNALADARHVRVMHEHLLAAHRA